MPRREDLPIIDLSGLDLKGQMNAWEEIAVRGTYALLGNEPTVSVMVRADEAIKSLVRAIQANMEVALNIEARTLSISLLYAERLRRAAGADKEEEG